MRKWGNAFSLAALAGLALIYSWDIVFLKRFLNHPEYVDYYPPYRDWFLQKLRHGIFPIWNSYWGLGHSSEIEASFPVDFFSLIELVTGPQYPLIQGFQALLILGALFWCFRVFHFQRKLALLGAILFLSSPWVSYFYLYFIKAGSFIGLALSVGALNRFRESPSINRGLHFTLATIFTFFGTKVEFWFFHCVFITLYAGCLFRIYRLPRNWFKQVAGYLALGILFHAWQIVPLWQILQISERLESPPGWRAVFQAELYSQLFHASWPESWLGLFKPLWGPFGLGAGGVLLFTSLKDFPKFNWRSVFYFLPLAYYWCRPLPGDLNEVTILQATPLWLRFFWGALLFQAARHVASSKLARGFWWMVVMLFFLRQQGQILLSYLFGIQWIPSRDNYLFDFCLVSLALHGLSVLKASHQRRIAILGFGGILAIWVQDPFWMHPLMANVPLDYPRVNGRSDVKEAFRDLRHLGLKPQDRVYFSDPEALSDLRMMGAALKEEVAEPLLFSSFIPKSYRLWSRYYWFGIPPELKWEAYEGEYTPETIRYLPKRETLGMHTNRVYWHSLHAMPTPSLYPLRLTGVRYVLGSQPQPEFSGLKSRGRAGKYYASEILHPLPRALFLATSLGAEVLADSWLPEPSAGKISLAGNLLHYQPVNFQETENQRQYQLNIKEPGFLIVNELAHPFWRATLNGQPVEEFAAFGILRAVKLNPGRHTLLWQAAIPYWSFAWAISALSALVVVGLILFQLPRPIFSKALAAKAEEFA